MQKISAKSISIYSANLATDEESWIFGVPFERFWVPTCDDQTRYDVIWNFAPIIFLSSLHMFYDKMATSEGGGVCISLIVTGPIYIYNVCRLNGLYL